MLKSVFISHGARFCIDNVSEGIVLSNSVKNVSLPAAFLPDTGRYIHISEKIPSEARLLCPFCSAEVGARKGSVRQHHFYHRAETNCSPSKETLLHEGAKIFLLNSLIKAADRY